MARARLWSSTKETSAYQDGVGICCKDLSGEDFLCPVGEYCLLGVLVSKGVVQFVYLIFPEALKQAFLCTWASYMVMHPEVNSQFLAGAGDGE